MRRASHKQLFTSATSALETGIVPLPQTQTLSVSTTHLLLEVGWWNEPFQKWDFKFKGRSWKKYPLQLTRWAHNWNRQHMKFQKMPAKKVFCSQLLPQSWTDYPPPIWSLPSLPITSQGFSMFLYFSRALFCICLALRWVPHHFPLIFTVYFILLNAFKGTNDLLYWNEEFLNKYWNVFRCDCVRDACMASHTSLTLREDKYFVTQWTITCPD